MRPFDLRQTWWAMLRDVVEVQLTRVKADLVVESAASLIDCGYAGDFGRISAALSAQGLNVHDLARVVITHGHPDHAGSARELAAAGVPILIHPADAANLRTTWRDVLARPSRGRVFAAMTPEPVEFSPIEDGQVLPLLGGLQVVHTPGHTPGSVCFLIANHAFTGDTILAGGIGRQMPETDLRRQMMSIGTKLLKLPLTTALYPGHGPATSLERELVQNPVFRNLGVRV